MHDDRTGSGDHLVGFLGMGMAVLILAGFGVFTSGHGNIAGQEPSTARSVFYVVNAATLTGFEMTSGVSDYKLLGQITIFVLILSGALLSLIVGGWSLTRILNMPHTDGQVVRAAVFEFLLAVLGAVMLLGTMGLWPAIFQATSALANAGHVLGQQLTWQDSHVHLILLPLALIGGLGVPVLLDISSSVRLGHKLHSHTRTVLMLTAGIYVAGTLLIGAIQWMNTEEFATLLRGGKVEYLEFKNSLIIGSTLAINSRSLGMDFGTFPLLLPASQWVILLLMLIGGSPGSTAGGIKNTTALVLVRDAWKLWMGEPVGRLLGLAALWTGLFMLVVFATTVLLALAQPQMPGERLIFLAVSAASNTGLSHAQVSLSDMGMYVLSAAMLFGRFAPLVILWQVSRDTMPGKG